MAGAWQAATISGCKTKIDETYGSKDSLKGQGLDPRKTLTGAHVGQKVTYVTGRSFPASRTHALESIPFIIAGATIVACGLVTLAVTWRKMSA